jgi:hypothetical protein
MYLVRLIYASKIPEALNQKDIKAILVSSRANNTLNNVTGSLIYSKGYFLQCLEGSRIKVNQLYHKILLDERHHDPSILKYEEISVREFDRWAMGFIPTAKISGELILKYSGEQSFNPYSMSGEACYLLLKELKSLALMK